MQISLRFVTENPKYNDSALVQVMGDKPLHKPMITKFTDIDVRYLGPLLLAWINFNPIMDK